LYFFINYQHKGGLRKHSR